MQTYQDYLAVEDNDKARIDFVSSVINSYRLSDFYETAEVAEEYAAHRNKTIKDYQKFLFDVTGAVVPDNYGANYKLASNFFDRFITQEVQFLLGNGVTWLRDSTAQKLGDDFDKVLQTAAKHSLVGGVCYGFYNYDHVEVFKAVEFAPLYDETNGALRAGVRFWRIDSTKPLRATLYDEEGYIDFIWKDGVGELMTDENGTVIGKKPYVEVTVGSEADRRDGTEIYFGENYPAFPIVPLWGNPHHQSEIVGIREQIDCYDLIKSGYANTIDEASFVYWAIQNAGGMDDQDLTKFVDHIRTVHAAIVEDDLARAEPHTIEAPHEGRDSLLDRLRKDLYDDYMALDTKDLASGAVTATQIEAAYEPMNSKADQFEFCVTDFIDGLLEVLGIEDKPTYTRSYIVNKREEMESVLQASQYLSQDYVTRKILTLLGDGDMADAIIEEMNLEDYNRMNEQPQEQFEEEPEEQTEEVVEE